MAETETEGAAATSVSEGESNLLDQVIGATRYAETDQAELLLKNLTEQALAGTVTFDRNMTTTLKSAVAKLDAKISEQLNAIMHHEKFKKLEGTWRGLRYLVMNSETSATLKLKVMNVTKKDLLKDFERADEFDQSRLFKQIYEEEFGKPGGEPYGALIADFEFDNHPQDIDLLSELAQVAAASFAPLISSAGPGLLGLDSFSQLSNPRDLEKIFLDPKYVKWRSFRDREDSRFVTLTMPRVLSRLPYGATTAPVEEFAYEEAPFDTEGNPKPMDHEDYCYMNAAYVLGARLTDSFAQSGFCVAIRGAEGGGRVDDLPMHVFTSDEGDTDLKCPTEIGITDRREAELSKLGFLPLCHYKNRDYAVFFGSQTVQKPKVYDENDATANAAISARLPYIMATSRFAHYLKVMARDMIGRFMTADTCQAELQRWIRQYINANEDAGQEAKARRPLRAAEIRVEEIPGAPGSFNAVAYLQPWLQMEELTTSMRLVAKIPGKA